MQQKQSNKDNLPAEFRDDVVEFISECYRKYGIDSFDLMAAIGFFASYSTFLKDHVPKKDWRKNVVYGIGKIQKKILKWMDEIKE